ncbi:NADH dehydrogenase [ubiquinone] 1 alpha subcomplex subunit 6-like [Aristolochia californica]|uniref:NADH dehydrogenase [ubiquinone] 1 alpha subcomplex subunit 6-like n=1 Tax=Aristolochia californica TaxID=171875 RepID=UPI0035D95ABC
MAHTFKSLKVPPNSATLEEAKGRVIDLFKKACRSLPTVLNVYHLDDVVTVSQLRSAISSKIRKNAHITNPKAIDLLVFNGMEELRNIIEHYKQRHHIVGEYVIGHEGLVHDKDVKDQGSSEFLKQFYNTNYF